MEEVVVQDVPRDLRLVVDRRFGPYLVGKLLSLTGLWAHNLVCVVLAYEVTGSVVVVGLVSVAQFGPQLLFAGWSGSIADRGDRLVQLVVGRVLAIASSVALGVWCLFGVDRPGTTAAILLSSVVMGLGLVVGGPAMMALVPSLVQPAELAAAVRLDSLPMLLGRTIGPAAGALVLAVLDAPSALYVAAAGNVAFILVLLGIRQGVRRAAVTTGDRSMRAALAHVRLQPKLALLLVAVAAAGFGSDPSLTLAPAIADLNHAGSATVGLYAGAFGLGSLLGALGMGALGRALTLQVLVSTGLVVLAASTAALALPIGTVGSASSFGLAGAGMSLATIACTTLLQLSVPDELRGRLMSLWLIGFVGSRPVAALVDGALADVFSVETALVEVGALVVLSAALCRPSRIAVTDLRGTLA